jgi:anti-anti-sigma factor
VSEGVAGGGGDGQPAQVQVERSGGEAVVTVTGELDLTNVAVLEDALGPLAGDPDVGVVVLDLGRLSFMDSSAIAVLVRVARTGTALLLRRPSPAVRELVETTGLTQILPVEP